MPIKKWYLCTFLLLCLCSLLFSVGAYADDTNGEKLFVFISAAYLIEEDGTVSAWGDNSGGLLGDGTTTERVQPVKVKNLKNIVKISANGHLALALDAEGRVWAWGNLSATGEGLQPEPKIVNGISDAVDIAVNNSYSYFAVTANGEIYVWGNTSIVDEPEQGYISVPVKIPGLENIAKTNGELAVGKDGKAWLIGGYGYISALPLADNPAKLYEEAGLTANNEIFFWRSNFLTDLAGDYYDGFILSGVTDVEKLLYNMLYYVALKSDGTVWTYGNYDQGNLGYAPEDTETPPPPKMIPNLSGITDIASARYEAAALDSSGHVWIWGDNNPDSYDPLPEHYTPKIIEDLDNVIKIWGVETFDDYLFFFLKSDGTLWSMRESSDSWAETDEDSGKPVRIKNVTYPGIVSPAMQAAKADGTPIKIIIDGEEKIFAAAPVVLNGTVFVPFKGIAETLGAAIEYDATDKKITAKKGSNEIVIRIGDDKAQINGETVSIGAEVASINGSAMTPLQFINESFNAVIDWNAAYQTVEITSKKLLGEGEEFERVSLLSDRLFLSIPAGYETTGGSETSSEYTYVVGADEYTLTVGETFKYSTGDIEKDAELMARFWQGEGLYYKLDGVKSVNGMETAVFSSAEYAADTAVVIKRMLVKQSDNTLLSVALSVNKSASNDIDYAVSLTDSIFGTIEAGTRELDLSERYFDLGDVGMSVAKDYMAYADVRMDFVVLRFLKFVPAGEIAPEMGIYSGNHGGFDSSIYNSGEDDTVLGRSIEWKYNTSNGMVSFDDGIQAIVNIDDNYGWILHVFMSPDSQSQYEEMLTMVRSLEYQ